MKNTLKISKKSYIKPPKKVIITGASGFIGSSLTKLLLKNQYHVIALENKTKVSLINSPNFSIVKLTDFLMDRGKLLNNSYALIHLASKTHSSIKDNKKNLAEYEKTNIHLTETICSLAIKHNIEKIIYLSSIKVNGEDSTKNGFHEDDIPRPTDLYGKTKLEAENTIKNLCLGKTVKYFILRPPLVYGDTNKGNIGSLVKLIKSGLPLPLNKINNKRSLIYIENLNSAILSCLKNDEVNSSIYLVCDDDSLSTPELITKIAKIMNKRIIIFNFPISLLSAITKLFKQNLKFDKLNSNLVANNQKFKQDFGWNPPYTTNKGIKKSFSRN